MTSRVRWGVIAVLVACALITASQSAALHRNAPLFLQVGQASGGTTGGMRFSASSNVLFFHSDADLLGNGNGATQIFAFDLASRVKREQHALYQLTFGNAPSRAPAATRRGRVVAFDSEADLLSNGSTGRQIFASTRAKFVRGIVPLMQVTRASADSFGVLVSPRRGRSLVFSSYADLRGIGLAPDAHLYRVSLPEFERSECTGYPCPGSPGLELITPFPAGEPDIDRKGERVVFTSRGDVAGTGCGVGIAQVFIRDLRAGSVEQLTCGAADSRHPVFTRSYHGVLFESDADLLGNGSTHTQIFQMNLRHTPHTLTQMTFGTDGDSTRPAPNGTRRKIRFFFHSTASLTDDTPPGSDNLYQFDETRGLIRLTDGQTLGADVAGQYTFAAFTSDADLVGNGNDTSQLFILNSYPLFEP